MNDFLKVEGYSGLIKDKTNGGVINVDKNSYKEYILARNNARKNIVEKQETQETISSMQSKINSMEDDISQIKNMILTLLEKGK
jgi:TolA-binding protein